MRVPALMLLALLVAPRAALAAYGCEEVPSQVTFQGFEATPPSPVVGNHVVLHFDVEYQVYSVTELQLQGASLLFEGETDIHGASEATFELSAVRSGTATVQLAVTYGTEEQCVDTNGNIYFQVGPDHTVTSPSYQVQIAAAGACPGDCDGDHQVSIAELVRGTAIALGIASPSSYLSFDADGTGMVTIDELLAAVRAALLGCGAG